MNKRFFTPSSFNSQGHCDKDIHFRDLTMLKLYAEGFSTKVLADLQRRDFFPGAHHFVINHHRRRLHLMISLSACEMVIKYISSYRDDYPIYGDKRTNFLFYNKHGNKSNRGNILKSIKRLIKFGKADRSSLKGILSDTDFNGLSRKRFIRDRLTRYIIDLKQIHLCAHPKSY